MSLVVQIKKKLPQFNLEVSFKANKEVLGILGGSGSGKSMTLRCIAGLETPTSGRIILNDRVLFDSERGINLPARQRNVGFLFQNYALFPHLTVFENISFGLKNISKAEEHRKVEQIIAAFRIEGLEARYPSQLSGGQQQRVALARATITEPDLLLLDEPFSALDNYLRSQLEKELIEVLDGYSGTTLFVTHNLEEAFQVCQQLIILDNGQKIAHDKKDDLFKNPPNYTSAQVTGCKNLSLARPITSGTLEAVDWGCKLKTTKSIPKNLTHVGIRSHNLTFVNDSGMENVFPCWLIKTREAPFSVTLYLTLNSTSNAANKYHLQADVFKEKWEMIKDRPFPWLVHLDPDRLFLTGSNIPHSQAGY